MFDQAGFTKAVHKMFLVDPLHDVIMFLRPSVLAETRIFGVGRGGLGEPASMTQARGENDVGIRKVGLEPDCVARPLLGLRIITYVEAYLRQHQIMHEIAWIPRVELNCVADMRYALGGSTEFKMADAKGEAGEIKARVELQRVDQLGNRQVVLLMVACLSG